MLVLLLGLGVWVALQFVPAPVEKARSLPPLERAEPREIRFRRDASTMVKEIKFLRKQAAKAERIARTISDAEISERFLSMAEGYRSQADVLKAKKLKGKKLKARKKPRKKGR
jgi:hypothetical protein